MSSYTSKIPVLAGSSRYQAFQFYSDIGDDQKSEGDIPLRFADPPPTLKELHIDGHKLNHHLDQEISGLGDNADVWEEYCNESAVIDRELISELNGSLDVLLIFAGLFCAVLAALLIESYKLLLPSNDDQSLVLLENILITLHNKTAPQLPMQQDFSPKPYAVRVNTLWFASLALALGVAVEVMLAKQWLHKYGEGLSNVPRLRTQLRQYRYDNLRRWALPEMVNFLPTLLHLALALFLLGLIDFLWNLNIFVATVTLSICTLFGGIYALLMILPHLYTDCPYKTPFSRLLGLAYFRIRTALHNLRGDHAAPPKFVSLEQAEQQAIQARRDVLQAKALAWLMTNSRSTLIVKTVTRSFASLTPGFTAMSILRQAGAIQRVAEQFLSCFTENKVSSFTSEPAFRFQLNKEKSEEAGIYARALVVLTEGLPATRWPLKPPRDLFLYSDALDSALGSLMSQTDDVDVVMYAIAAREHVYRAGRNRFPNNRSQAPAHSLGELLDVTRKVSDDELIPSISGVVCILDTIRRCVEATALEQRYSIWEDFSVPLMQILEDTPPECRVRESLSRVLACFAGLSPSRDYSDGNDPTEHRIIFALSSLLAITDRKMKREGEEEMIVNMIAAALSVTLESYSSFFVHSIRPLSEPLALLLPLISTSNSTEVKKSCLDMIRHADYTDLPPNSFSSLMGILKDSAYSELHPNLAQVLDKHMQNPHVSPHLADPAILRSIIALLAAKHIETRVQASSLLLETCSSALRAGGKAAQRAALDPLIKSGLLEGLSNYFRVCTATTSTADEAALLYGREDNWVPRLLTLLDLYQTEIIESEVMEACILMSLQIQPGKAETATNLKEWWSRYTEWVNSRSKGPKPRAKGALYRRQDV